MLLTLLEDFVFSLIFFFVIYLFLGVFPLFLGVLGGFLLILGLFLLFFSWFIGFFYCFAFVFFLVPGLFLLFSSCFFSTFSYFLYSFYYFPPISFLVFLIELPYFSFNSSCLTTLNSFNSSIENKVKILRTNAKRISIWGEFCLIVNKLSLK